MPLTDALPLQGSGEVTFPRAGEHMDLTDESYPERVSSGGGGRLPGDCAW